MYILYTEIALFHTRCLSVHAFCIGVRFLIARLQQTHTHTLPRSRFYRCTVYLIKRFVCVYELPTRSLHISFYRLYRFLNWGHFYCKFIGIEYYLSKWLKCVNGLYTASRFYTKCAHTHTCTYQMIASIAVPDVRTPIQFRKLEQTPRRSDLEFYWILKLGMTVFFFSEFLYIPKTDD